MYRETYDDILQMSYPLSTINYVKHPRMSLQDRAKIYAPFAALKGYEEAIAEKQRIVVPKVELTEEAKQELDRKLCILEQQLKEGAHPIVSVIYFEAGVYLQFTGMVAKLLPTARTMQIVDKRLLFDDIRQMDGEIFDEMLES